MRTAVREKSQVRAFVVHYDEPTSELLEAQAAFAREGYKDAKIRVDRVYRVEGSGDLSPLMRLFANPAAGESIQECFGPYDGQGTCVEVAYRPSVDDPETRTGLDVAEFLHLPGVKWIRIAKRYIVEGVEPVNVREIIKRNLFNKLVNVVVKGQTYKRTLRPTGKAEPTKLIPLTGLDKKQLRQVSEENGLFAPVEQMLAIQAYELRRGQALTNAEIQVISQRWCDHCDHTTWKRLGILKKVVDTLKEINHPLWPQIEGGNAGVMLFYDGYTLCIKIESHNHPFGIAPFGAVQTGHGGGQRDIIAELAEILGGVNLVGTRDPAESWGEVPEGAVHALLQVLQATSGAATYCNSMGVPMMYYAYRRTAKHAKPMWMGGAMGYAPLSALETKPLAEGDVLILFGGSTGRDGIHGATGSSANLSAKMVGKEGATVQIGGPIIQQPQCLLFPLLRGKAKRRTDLGAGGISCAAGELSKDDGAELDITDIPLKDNSLSADEKLISESQERNMGIFDPNDVSGVLELAHRFNVQACPIGTIRKDKRFIVWDNGQKVVDLDQDFLTHGCPLPPLSIRKPRVRRRPVEPTDLGLGTANTPSVLKKIAGNYAVADQSWAGTQFDQTVKGRTVVGPHLNGVPSDAFVCTPFFDKPYGAVSSYAYVPNWYEADPVGALRMIMALAISRTVAIGADPSEIVLSSNFYNPTRTAEQRWYLCQMVEEKSRLEKRWGIPSIVGKDSSSGTFTSEDGIVIDVPHTYIATTLSRMPDVAKVTTKLFKRPGDEIYLVHPGCKPNLSGSVLLNALDKDFGKNQLLPWPILEEKIMQIWKAISNSREHISSIGAIGEGGAFAQLLHACLGSGLGADITVTTEETSHWVIAGESPASFLVSTSDPSATFAAFSGIECLKLGYVTELPGMGIRYHSGEPMFALSDWPEAVSAWRDGFVKEVC